MRRRAGLACRDPRCTSRDLSKCDSPPLIYTQRKVLREYKLRHEPSQPRLRVVPHFSSGMVERAKASARENHPMREEATRVSPFLAWGDFHARSRFARSTIPEEKWGTTRSLSQPG